MGLSVSPLYAYDSGLGIPPAGSRPGAVIIPETDSGIILQKTYQYKFLNPDLSGGKTAKARLISQPIGWALRAKAPICKNR